MFKLKSKTLRAAFMVAVLATGASVVPSSLIANAEAGAAASAAVIAGARRNAATVHIINAVLTDPSDSNIQAFRNRGLITELQVPYVFESVRDMNIPTGTQAGQINEVQRRQLKGLIINKQNVAIFSAPTAEQAVAKGLSQGLAPYFIACREKAPSGEVGLQEAKSIERCVQDSAWKKW